MKTYEYYMEIALKEAIKAKNKNEVPVGAVIVDENGKIVAKAYNKKESTKQVIAHAEILAILKLSKKIKDWRLNNYTLFVNVEPCPMCASAILQSRISKVVYGCKQPISGAFSDRLNLNNYSDVKCEIIGGILEEKSSLLMKQYFKEKRQKPC